MATGKNSAKAHRRLLMGESDRSNQRASRSVAALLAAHLLPLTFVMGACGSDEREPLPTLSFDCSGALTLEQAWESLAVRQGQETMVKGVIKDTAEGHWEHGTPYTIVLVGESEPQPDNSYTLPIYPEHDVDADRYIGKTLCARGILVPGPNADADRERNILIGNDVGNPMEFGVID